MKKRFALAAALCFCLSGYAQNDDPVVMTIDGKDIKRSEFEYIYNKNNQSSEIDKKSLDEYVDLFINFKLKVAEAEAAPLAVKAVSGVHEIDGPVRHLPHLQGPPDAPVPAVRRLAVVGGPCPAVIGPSGVVDVGAVFRHVQLAPGQADGIVPVLRSVVLVGEDGKEKGQPLQAGKDVLPLLRLLRRQDHPGRGDGAVCPQVQGLAAVLRPVLVHQIFVDLPLRAVDQILADELVPLRSRRLRLGQAAPGQ